MRFTQHNRWLFWIWRIDVKFKTDWKSALIIQRFLIELYVDNHLMFWFIIYEPEGKRVCIYFILRKVKCNCWKMLIINYIVYLIRFDLWEIQMLVFDSLLCDAQKVFYPFLFLLYILIYYIILYIFCFWLSYYCITFTLFIWIRLFFFCIIYLLFH